MREEPTETTTARTDAGERPRGTVRRRRLLQSAGVLGATGLSGCLEAIGLGGDEESEPETGAETETEPDDGDTGPDHVTVGVLQPLTGDVAYYGQLGLWGFLSGIAYKHGIEPPQIDSAGTETVETSERTYELHVEDTAFDENRAQTLASELVEDRGVDVLYGTASSDSARRVIETVAEPTETPMITGPAAASDLTYNADYCTEYTFRASEDTVMDAQAIGRYLATETEVESVYIMGADYSFGREVARNYRDVLERENLLIAGEQFVPQGYAEFGPLYGNAVEAGADAVVGGFTVATLPAFLEEGLAGDHDLRMIGGFSEAPTMAAVGAVVDDVLGPDVTEAEIRDAKFGPFTTRYHWNQYDNEINDWLIEHHTAAYDAVPDLFTAGTFTAASSLVQAIDERQSTASEDLVGALRGMTVADTPKGTDAYTYQEYNNQARSEMTVCYPTPTTGEWADYWASSIMPSEPVARIDAADATMLEDDPSMECQL